MLTRITVYSNIGKKYPEEWASTILGILAIFITAPVYYFYKKGPQIRMRSKFAQQVAKDRENQLNRRRQSTLAGNDEKGRGSEGGGVMEKQEEDVEAASPRDGVVNRGTVQRE